MKNVYFIQSKYDKEVSFNYNSNMRNRMIKVHNKWLNQDIEIYSKRYYQMVI